MNAPPAAPASPFAGRDLSAYAADLRRGAVSIAEATRALLDRQQRLEPRLQACTHVDAERALRHAGALDALLASRVDLGPLMGVPVLVKDLYSIDGMPTTAGTRLDIADLVPPQGSFVNQLLRSGCVLMGKTRTTEFALGGHNLRHGVPWNPCDARVPRMTGGSSHGSAVSMAARTCGFSVGSDTGGSVRWPAALCGVVGYKASTTRWAGDGIWPLSPQFDSVGCFTATAADAALIEATLDQRAPQAVPALSTLTLAVPRAHFMDNLDRGVAICFEAAWQRLRDAGVRLVERDIPQAGEIDAVFRLIVPADLLAFLGRDRVRQHLQDMDPVAAERALAADGLNAEDYLRIRARSRQIVHEVQGLLSGVDAWLTPTVPMQPAPTADFKTVEQVAAWNRLATQNTRPCNLFDHCGISLPVHHLGADLPVGLQLCAPGGQDARLLAIAQAVESAVGRPAPADTGSLMNAG
jgi:aspartyl-tRNA(Asn)/glutamyl-tRNA(Gln) amidotransferase subunit A